MRQTLLAAGSGGSFAGHPYDAEFNGGQGDWLIWEGIPPNTADFNSTVPGAVYMESGTIITRASIPAFPFTVEAFCSSILYDDINTVYANATLGLGPTPPDINGGGFYGLEWDVDTLGKIGIFDGKFVPMFGDTPDHFGTIQENTSGLVNQVPFHQKMVVHSASNIDLYYRRDSSPSFTTYLTGVNPAMASMTCLYLVSFGCTTAWDWIRFT
jgi:hypothetical protein